MFGTSIFSILNMYLQILGNLTFIRVIGIICSIAEALSRVCRVFEAAITRIVGVIHVYSRAEAMIWVSQIRGATTARISSVIDGCTIAEALPKIVGILETAAEAIVRIIDVFHTASRNWWYEASVVGNASSVGGNHLSVCTLNSQNWFLCNVFC